MISSFTIKNRKKASKKILTFFTSYLVSEKRKNVLQTSENDHSGQAPVHV